ncbi:nuclear fusion defective 6 [Striga asiatica]|uniref:Nuclear fusion defective 6 n=1 Tax=Striga asiatica TaxID=4170 RepID=A0A5A7QG58_STRAF|nr:nuclear fusion defective 6 [Striga asiatica]
MISKEIERRKEKSVVRVLFVRKKDIKTEGASCIVMKPPHQHPRINLDELKAQIVKKLGPDMSKQYFHYLHRFLSLKLSKPDFNKLCLRILGWQNIPLHNQLIRSILRNSCTAKTPPPFLNHHHKDDISNKVNRKEILADGHQKNGSHIISTTHLSHSPGLPNGKMAGPNVVSKNGDMNPMQHHQELVQLAETGHVGPAPLYSENDENAPSRSPIRAPLGLLFCPASVGGSHRWSVGTLCDGALLDSHALRERMDHIAVEMGLAEGVSLDCADVLNHGLDCYMRGLIKFCVDLVGSRSGGEFGRIDVRSKHQERKKHDKIDVRILLQDFRVAMEMNPQRLASVILVRFRSQTAQHGFCLGYLQENLTDDVLVLLAFITLVDGWKNSLLMETGEKKAKFVGKKFVLRLFYDSIITMIFTQIIVAVDCITLYYISYHMLGRCPEYSDKEQEKLFKHEDKFMDDPITFLKKLVRESWRNPLYLIISRVPQIIFTVHRQNPFLLHTLHNPRQQIRDNFRHLQLSILPKIRLHARVHPPQYPQPESPKVRTLRNRLQKMQIHVRQNLHRQPQRTLHTPRLPLRILSPRILHHLLVKIVHHREYYVVERVYAVCGREQKLLCQDKALLERDYCMSLEKADRVVNPRAFLDRGIARGSAREASGVRVPGLVPVDELAGRVGQQVHNPKVSVDSAVSEGDERERAVDYFARVMWVPLDMRLISASTPLSYVSGWRPVAERRWSVDIQPSGVCSLPG